MKALSITIFWFLLAQYFPGNAQPYPDQVYPIPNNYGEINEGGINLFSGDLNLSFSLAHISGKHLGYSLRAFYNSRSASLSRVSNELGGNGWKLMDYPKVVQDGSGYYLLDGERKHLLHPSGNSQYLGDGDYYLWKFNQSSDGWVITTDEGTVYQLTNAYTGSHYSYWNLRYIIDSNWGDTLHFSYAGMQLAGIRNDLGDSLACRYSGTLSDILIFHCNRDSGNQTMLKGQTVIKNNSVGIVELTNRHRLPNGDMMNESPGTTFIYDTNGRLYQVISPSGSVQSYLYYVGSTHESIQGAVIRYGLDNGYERIVHNSQSPDADDDDASYSSIWYDLDNDTIDNNQIYRRFNHVRVYPGGFRTGSDYHEVFNPFGHHSWYFFNGISRSELDSLPSGNFSINVENEHLLGIPYKNQTYSDDAVIEDPDELISSASSIYELKTFSTASASTSFASLTKFYSEEDGTNADTTWYIYYDSSSYFLPRSIISSRYNPKRSDPDYKEYSKETVRYAFQDYPELKALNLLTPTSQRWSEAAPNTANVGPESQSLNWQITDASLTTWKAWNNSAGWDAQAEYILKEKLPVSGIPLNLNVGIDASKWLLTDSIVGRTFEGNVKLNQDANGIQYGFTYDQYYNFYPIASFTNGNPHNHQAGYLGFERYESSSKWNTADGQIISSDARAGRQSFQLDGLLIAKEENYSPNTARKYVFGAFVKSADSSEVVAGFKDGSVWSDSVKFKSGSTWEYLSVVATSPGSGFLPAISCKGCLIDDIRFHPVDASFSAIVYEDRRVADNHTIVDSAGIYNANYIISVNGATRIDSTERLVLSAGERISFGANVSIATGAVVQASILDFSLDMGKTTATLRDNGEVYQKVFDGMENPIALAGPTNELRYLNMSYNSREGIGIFGNSDPDDPFFDQNHPNMGLEVTARQSGLWEGFQFEEQSTFSSVTGQRIVNGLLTTDLQLPEGTSSSTLNEPINAKDYAVFVEMFPDDIRPEQSLEIEIGASPNTVHLIFSSNEITLGTTTSDHPFGSMSLNGTPKKLDLLLVVMDGKHAFVYANGRFLFDYTFSYDIKGTLRLISTNPGGSFDNFMLIEDPLIGKNAYDAAGNHRQTLFHSEPDELFVSATLYGDYLSFPVAATRGTHINSGANGTDKGLSYRTDFANLTLSDNNSPEVSGEIHAAFGYSTPFIASRTYKDDPSFRSDRMGSGGKFTAGRTHSLDHNYSASSAANSFDFEEDELKEQQSKIPYAEGQHLTVNHYIGTSTGILFASTHKDSLANESIHQQQTYNESLRLEEHYQPNYFELGGDDFYSETAYDFFGNSVREVGPDQGVRQYAYGPNFRHRVTLDANGVANPEPYYLYWKYDSLGRIIEEGIYQDDSINLEPHPTISGTILAPGVITLDSGSFSDVTFQYGTSVQLKSGVRLGPGVSFQLDESALQDHVGSRLNHDWPTPEDPNRKVKRTYTYDYDSSNAANKAIGRLVCTTSFDHAGNSSRHNTEAYTYDPEGNIVTTALTIDQEYPDEFSYTYDLTRNITSIRKDTLGGSGCYPYHATYSYDRLNRVKSIGDSSHPSKYATYTYTNGGFTETLGNGIFSTFSTNEEGLTDTILYSKADTIFFEALHYTNRKNGQPGYFNGAIASISYDSEGSSATDIEYTYDAFGRLKSDTSGSVIDSWKYDANGNILLSLEKTASNSFQYYPGTNQLQQFGSDRFTYDANGNVTSSALHTISKIAYDPFTYLTTEIDRAELDASVQLRYNSHDQRIRKNEGGNSLTYLHGLSGYPFLEIKSIGGTHSAQAYVYGPAGTVAILEMDSVSSTVYYPLEDYLGSTRVVTDSSGTVIAHFDYHSYGKLTSESTTAPPLPVRYLYTGQEYDSEIELYNYRARMYDPAIGRFYAPDPWGQQNSPYAYAGDNPISFSDPTGDWFGWDDLVATVGGAVAGAGLEFFSEVISGEGVHIGKIAVAGLAGAAAGETELYTMSPLAAGAVYGGLNKLGDDALEGKFNPMGVAKAAGIGGITGLVGGRVGGAVTERLGAYGGRIQGKMLSGMAAGGAAGATGQAASNIMNGENPFNGVPSAILLGAGTGGIGSSAHGLFTNYNSGYLQRRTSSIKVNTHARAAIAAHEVPGEYPWRRNRIYITSSDGATDGRITGGTGSFPFSQLLPGERYLPGYRNRSTNQTLHAEMVPLRHRLTPTRTEVSIPVCTDCATEMRRNGTEFLSPQSGKTYPTWVKP